ncbi:tetratricopeptide repeat protein [Phaeobacter sp. J2-8]|uniref:tetratricopeptide repeat protein n=1 Tax=Phaeobacter sp. J2-8 TaxID=2931394 RepID=UPI001FD304DE|nr:tetratricopeptide repeat protein [Phaeobacter sp. J2-8]MCJ7874794.1 sel1 repeat family protein [Phaeobacter sp. J2-8]
MRFLRQNMAAVMMVIATCQTGIAQDLSAVPFEKVQQQADIGSPIAQIEIANRYLDGDGVLQNFVLAARWFEKAAVQGEAAAQNSLGKLYHAGFGVARDVPVALRLLLQAATTGNAQFMHDYASVVETPAGGADFAAAAEFYQRAAAAGHVDAAVSLAVLYQNGTGVPQDMDRARRLYQSAAVQDHPRALNNLGLLYVRGDGVAQDYGRAALLFERAAELGLPMALRNLGVMYENGFGVALDENKAATLYRMASTGAGAESAVHFVNDARLAPLGQDAETMAQVQKAAIAAIPWPSFNWALRLSSAQKAPFKTCAPPQECLKQQQRQALGPRWPISA